LVIASALFVVMFSAGNGRADNLSVVCGGADEVAFLPAPITPWKGAPLRVIVAVEKPIDGVLTLAGPDGSVTARSAGVQGGPPYFWYAEVASPTPGTWHATLTRPGASAGCNTVTRDIAVLANEPPKPRGTAASVWPVRNAWNRVTEDLFSAWIQKLFDAPLDADLSWKTWSGALRDKSRNMLFDYLGSNEDAGAMTVRPDCADFVYFLRAYFAYKMGLPFGYSNCSRGLNGAPPKCYQWFDIQHPEVTRPPPPEQTAAAGAPPPSAEPPPAAVPQAPPKPSGPPSFGVYLRAVGDVVHTGSVRVAAADDNTDFYMVPLTQEALRPGTVYADPYGHVLMLVRRVPQSGGAAGIFLAVDAEPDGSVTRKRFWRGNFLFVHDPRLGSPGFKNFRPIVREPNGALRRLTNAEIAKDPQYGNFSLEQSSLGLEDFYDRMEQVMSPQPLDPLLALKDAIASLDEQVKTRVTSVENGRKYQVSKPGDTAMPDGPAIFETTGAWEDFSTPARDFRLLIAIDVVRGYPDRVERHPERYAMPFGKSPADVKAQLQAALATELAAHKFSYTRSDDSQWTLSLQDVIDRMGDLEMAYNPNDCVELRWGAPDRSDEASTCKRHAPAAQRAKMTEFRTWFRDRHWPHA
jgi:hypothetical protein